MMFLIAEVRRIDGQSLGVIVLQRRQFTTRADPTGRAGWEGQGTVTIEGADHDCRIAAIAVGEPVLAEAVGGPG